MIGMTTAAEAATTSLNDGGIITLFYTTLSVNASTLYYITSAR